MSTPLYILIVEDSEADTILIMRELQRNGYDPTFERVDTPEAFSAALAGRDWDIVIADYTMPRFSGLDALRLLQESQLDLPFIIISGTIGEEIAVATMKAGAHDYVMKDNMARLGPAVRRELREAGVRLAREQAEEALQASQEYARNLVDSSLDMIVAVDVERRIVEFNKAAQEAFGYTIEEVLGKHVDILYADPRDGLTIHQAALERGQCTREVINRRKNGAVFPCLLAASVLCDAHGGLTGVMGISRDITERKRAEEALRESEEKYRTILENIEAGYYQVDLAGNFTFFNDSLCRILGYPADELMGMNNRQYMDDETVKTVYQTFNMVYQTGKPTQALGWELVRKDGSKRFVETFTALITDSASEPSGFRGIVRDVTERKRAEKVQALLYKISEATNTVRNLQDLFRSIHDSVGELMPVDNFYIALYDSTDEMLSFPYFVDERDEAPAPRNLGRNLTEYVLRTEEPLLASPEVFEALVAKGQVEQMGATCIDWLGVPLKAQDKTIGALVVQSYTAGVRFGEEEKNLLVFVSAQIAMAIERVRAEEERERLLAALQRRSGQLQTAAEVSRAASSILDPDELIQQTVDLVRERFSLYYAGLFLVDRTGEWTGEPGKWTVLRAGSGAAGRQMLEQGHKLEIGGASMIGWCVANEQARIALDVGQDAVRFDNPLLPETRSELALPLISRGQATGALTIQSSQEAAFSEEDIVALQTMADQLANAIQTARLFEETRSRAERLALLNYITEAVGATLHLDDLLETVYREISSVFQADAFFIALYDEETDELDFRFVMEEGSREYPGRVSLSGLTSFIVTEKKPLLVRNLEQERDRLPEPVLVGPGEVCASWLGAPMLVGGRAIGVINVQAYQPYAYGEEDQLLLTTIADQVSMAVEKARLYEQAQQEIAERKQVEEALRESEEHCRRLVEISPDGIVVHSEGKVVLINAVGASLIGAENPGQLIGCPVMDFVHPDYWQVAARRIQQALQEGERSPPIHEKFIRLDGTLVDVEVTGAPFVYLDKPSMLLVIRDITERRQAEEALRESEQRYRALVTQSPIGVITCDREGHVTHANPALLQALGSPRSGVGPYGTMPGEEASRQFNLLTMPSLVEAGAASDFRRCMEEATQITAEYHYHSYWGKESILRVRLTPLRDESGTVSGALATVEDVTEQRQLQEQLIQSAKLASIGRLAAGVGHEINNPINGIINYAQLLLNKAEPDSRQAHFLEGILREGGRVANIVRDLLTFARVEKEAHSPAHVPDILRATLALTDQQLRSDSIFLEIEEQPDLPQIKCRSQRIQQVFLNLISNAHDALNARYPGGDPNKRLTIRIERVEKEGQPYVRTVFHDRGTGIAAHNLAHIFTPFFTTKKPDEGTGLGLSVSYGIVQEHHGDIQFESVEGDASHTIFQVDLPLDPGWA